jgi:hypothetical protein
MLDPISRGTPVALHVTTKSASSHPGPYDVTVLAMCTKPGSMPGMAKTRPSMAKTEWTVTPVLVKATTTPEIVTLPARLALAVDGRGAPHGDGFEQALSSLYGVAYGLKFARKKSGRNTSFKVAPLEGLWSAEGWSDPLLVPPPEMWTWRLRITVPPDVSDAEIAESIRQSMAKKGGNLEGSSAPNSVFLERICEIRCGRILHMGPYADEPRSFAVLAKLIEAAGLRAEHTHIEVYLSDPRRVTPEKMKTVLFKKVS